MRRLLILSLLVGGCAATETHRSDSAVTPVSAPAPMTVSNQITTIGYSVQRRPIELHQLGVDVTRPVLIMGAIHGDEQTSAAVAAGMLDYLTKHSDAMNGTPVAIITMANPDGYAAVTRVNANHVDLNRNFPAANWSARSAGRARRNFGGAASASEPETIALMQTIERLQPRLIISIHSMEKPCNNYDGPAQAVAETMARHNGYPATPTIGYPTPGSLGSWAGIDRQIPMVTLELPRKLPGDQAWQNNRDAILSAIAMAK
jgi:protein MpaA